MRLIHTADLHLDASFAAAVMPPGFGARCRDDLRQVFHAIMRRAAAWPADAVLIAGDLFDQDRVTRSTVAFLREQFEVVRPIPVFIAPGNRDPYVPGSPYATEAWPANVYVFDGPVWTAHALKQADLTVHGFAFDGPDISSNPFAMLQIPDDGRFHVAVAHGSERAHLPAGKACLAPFDAPAAVPEGLDYFALGHYHGALPIAGAFAAAVHYAGAPQGHGFHEPGNRHYLEVELEAGSHGPMVRVQPVASSKTVFCTYTRDAMDCATPEELTEALRATARAEERPQAARVVMTGPCTHAVQDALPAVCEAVADAFEFIHIEDATYSAEDYPDLSQEATSLAAFVRRIDREIQDAPDEARRRMLIRTRDVGLAAYRGRDLPIRGTERPVS